MPTRMAAALVEELASLLRTSPDDEIYLAMRLVTRPAWWPSRREATPPGYTSGEVAGDQDR